LVDELPVVGMTYVWCRFRMLDESGVGCKCAGIDLL